jgi:opacity protein-like surface antigen
MVSAQRGAEIAPFAQTTLLSPDWGPTNNLGYVVGLDYTRFTRLFVQPSLEVRMTAANGDTVGERSYTGGLKLQTTIHGIHPYATLLAGYGAITFTHPIGNYLSDNSMVYSLGGGVEFNVTRQLKMRVDFTHQQWNLDPVTLTPVTLGVGLAYSLPFFHSGGVQ